MAKANTATKPASAGRPAERLKLVRGRSPEASGGMPALERLVHERIRLGILSALAVNNSLPFGELKSLLQTTDGNLSVHARKLEEAGYITCTKYFDGRVPRTVFRLAAAGRRALERYLGHLEAVIRAARQRPAQE